MGKKSTTAAAAATSTVASAAGLSTATQAQGGGAGNVRATTIKPNPGGGDATATASTTAKVTTVTVATNGTGACCRFASLQIRLLVRREAARGARGSRGARPLTCCSFAGPVRCRGRVHHGSSKQEHIRTWSDEHPCKRKRTRHGRRCCHERNRCVLQICVAADLCWCRFARWFCGKRRAARAARWPYDR